MKKESIVRIGFRIPYDLNTWLIIEAQKYGISKNAFLIKLLWDWVKDAEVQK